MRAAIFLLLFLTGFASAQTRIPIDSQSKIVRLDLDVDKDCSVKWDSSIPINYQKQTLWITVNTDPSRFVPADGGAYLTLGRFKSLRINANITNWNTRETKVETWEIVLTSDPSPDPDPQPDPDPDDKPDPKPDPNPTPPQLDAKYGLGPVAWQAVMSHATDKTLSLELAKNFTAAADLLNPTKGKNRFTVQQVIGIMKNSNATIWTKPGWSEVESAIENWLKSDTTTRVQSRQEHEEAFREVAEWLKEIK